MDSKNPLVEIAEQWHNVLLKVMSIYDDASVAVKTGNTSACIGRDCMEASFHALMAFNTRLNKRGIYLTTLLSLADQAAIRIWILANGFGVMMWDMIKTSDVELDLRTMHATLPLEGREELNEEIIAEARKRFECVRRDTEYRASQKRTQNSRQGQAVHAKQGARSDDARGSMVRTAAEEEEAARILEEIVHEKFGDKARLFRLDPQGPCPICLKERGTLDHLVQKHKPSDLERIFTQGPMETN